MSKKNVVNPETSASDKLVSWIVRHRVVLSIVFGVVIGGAIATGIIVAVVNSKEAKRGEQFLPIRKAYEEVKSSDEKDYTAVLDSLNSFISGKKDYANFEALFTRASILFEQKKYDEAYNDYDKIDSLISDKGMFKDVAIYSKAVCKENLGEDAEAEVLYNQVWEDYGLASPQSAPSLFALYRFAEKNDNKEEMSEWAKLIKENYPYSDYTKVVEPSIIEEKTDEVVADDSAVAEDTVTEVSEGLDSSETDSAAQDSSVDVMATETVSE